jgi:hypothetical protein
MTQPNIAAEVIDPFFEVIYDGEWNACVGIQGDPEAYVDGYMEAALELASAVIDKRMYASRDTLAMPILYNCRHALELALKFAIDRLHKMQVIASPHPINHDIRSHWQHLSDAKVGDEKLRDFIAQMEPYVASLAAVDNDGQELRYAQNRDGDRSLGAVAVVNLPHVRRSIERLGNILNQFKWRIHDLEDERATGTHTKECSREDLEYIATVLGDHSTWHLPSFDDRKAEIQKHFGLGNGKTSQAIAKIRASRTLAAMVGLETDLTHVSDDKVLAALRLWKIAYPPKANAPDDLGTSYFERDFEKVKEHSRRTHELCEAVIALLTLEELADLEVLFYIGRDRVHGEHYDEMLAGTIEQRKGDRTRWEGAHHLMTKTSLLECVKAGAIAVGRPSLSVKIDSLHASPVDEIC